MPELKWHYGYFFVLGFMGLITLGLILWFKRKGWFNTDKE
jgi:magnesium transporter